VLAAIQFPSFLFKLAGTQIEHLANVLSTSTMDRASPPGMIEQFQMLTSIKSENAALIAVMGATGSGKSTFINRACPKARMRVGEDLQSCTSVVQISPSFTLNGRTVYLIDTPGFDDTTRSNVEVLQDIAVHLAESYKRGIKLCGIIFIHRITDNRIGGVSRQNIRMFEKLCGFDVMKNVILVTNMWGDLPSQQAGEKREAQLKSDDAFFKQMVARGAELVRHYNTIESVNNIILKLLAKEGPIVTKLQEEMVDEEKNLTDTAAGDHLNHELSELQKKHEEDMRELRREMDDNIGRSNQYQKELREEAEELKRTLDRIQKDKEKISKDYDQMKAAVEEGGGGT
jgi:GTPase Era involved in 16S rRNA processing